MKSNMPGKFYLLSIFSVILSIHCAWSQTAGTFINRAAVSLESQPATEKVYLHLNKPSYDFGDTIWYKAYTVVGQHHQLSALSGVLYVELLSPKDSLVARQILALTSGVAWSEIPLSKTLPQGNYRIRAYTTWMRNAGPDYFYDQKIRLGGVPAAVNPVKASEKPDVQFFPEGGELVNGVRSRVAIKSVGANGLGEDIKGTIEDNDGNVVADFATQHLGMGVFALTPQSGKTYKAKISIGETGFTVDLPKAKEEGFTLALNNRLKDSIYIKVAVNQKVLSTQKGAAFYIIAQNAGKAYYTTEGKLEDLVHTARVEKSRFPSGVTQFTLFSQGGEPLAERIAFIQSSDTLQLHIASSAAQYTTRQPVKLTLSAKDQNHQPTNGSFSVSVINETLAAADELSESTILNNLLLTSDLKGNIEQRNYYFTNINEQTNADLDVLMLTQGYRRFEWKEILNSTNPAITYPPETSLTLSGTLKTPSGKPIPNGSITLLVTKENLLRDTTTDLNGNFKFANIHVTDTANIVLKARKANKNDNLLITLQPPGYAAITPGTFPETKITLLKPQAAAVMQQRYTDYVKEQQLSKKSIQLKQVNIHGNRPPKKPELTFSSNLNGPGHADQIIMGKDVQGCVTLSDCLQGRLTGIIFSHPDAWGRRVPYLMRAMGRLSGTPGMAVIVDGMIMTGDHLDDFNTQDIASIEVLRSGAYLAIYGSNAPGGALVITTKRGGEDSRAATPKSSLGLLAYNFAGYYKAKTFYTPKYKAKGNTQLTDLRNAIYWNPNVLSDKEGKASFEFFNNDTKGTYRVVVEGIDDNGNLGRAVFRYNISR